MNADDLNPNPSPNPNHNNRYNRQAQVPQIGEEGQSKLAKAHVAIVGMGGLGCPVAQYLAGAGVGKLTLIDHDVVSLSNLHRQILYRESDINHLKAEIAKQRLQALNSEINLIANTVRLTADNIADLLMDATVVVDATDNFAISYLLSDFCMISQKPLVSGSVMGVTGYLGVFCWGLNHQIPSLRAVFPNPPQVGQDCNSIGVVGTSAGIIGTLQAQEVIKVIMGDSAQLAGRLLSVDTWTLRQTIMDFRNANEPSVCAKIISENDINSIDDIHSIDEMDWIIDVRSDEEVQRNPKILQNVDIHHIPMNKFVDDLIEVIKSLPTDKRIVLTCRVGQRALSVADRLIESGFENVAVWL